MVTTSIKYRTVSLKQPMKDNDNDAEEELGSSESCCWFPERNNPSFKNTQ